MKTMRKFSLSLLLVAGLALPAAGDSWTTGLYRYDGSGNVWGIGNDRYYYDLLSRLSTATTTVDGTARSQGYEYDAAGDITAITTDGTRRPIGVSGTTNRITDPGYHYDGRRNLTADPYATYAWDAANVVVRRTTASQDFVYLYTAGDERIAIIEQSGGQPFRTTWTLRDLSDKVVREYESTGGAAATDSWAWKKDYVYRGSQLLASIDSTRTLHYHLDHLGTPRLITDQGGVKVSTHTYLPFGVEATSPSQDAERMKFTGHERDFTAGDVNVVDYMHARYYDARVGRFLSVDPKLNLKRALRQPQNWNRYAYVMNNPLNYTDPTGEDVSIRLNFSGDRWTDEEKKKIILQVSQWYQQQNVGKVFVFDGAKANHGGNFLTRMFSNGYATLGVSSGTGSKHTPSTVFAGNYSSLSAAQRINAISNSIIHETAAHRFGATAGNTADQMFFARDGGYPTWDSVRQRYGTVADSYSYADPATRGNVTNGPIPIHPDDQKKLQSILRDEDVEPPDYDK